MLLMHGAEIDAKTNNNQTAILIAIQHGITTIQIQLDLNHLIESHSFL